MVEVLTELVLIEELLIIDTLIDDDRWMVSKTLPITNSY